MDKCEKCDKSTVRLKIKVLEKLKQRVKEKNNPSVIGNDLYTLGVAEGLNQALEIINSK